MKRTATLIFTFICLGLTSISYAFPQHALSSNGNLPAGFWRGELLRTDGQIIPFNFETKQVKGKAVLYILNGTERLLIDSIRASADSIYIEMPFFDCRFAASIMPDKSLRGNFIKNYGNRIVTIPFRARPDISERFPESLPATRNVTGRWDVYFKDVNDSLHAVGEFNQTGNRVNGTFLTTTGDYRYLDGVMSGDTLKLGTFDGGHAYYFVARMEAPDKMSNGFFYGGATSTETWTAERNENAKLEDEYSLTRLRDSSEKKLHFSFQDLKGNRVSISDPAFKNKVVIIQILGSWCPNCMDETGFLSPWYTANKSRGVEVIGLAYERTSSYADAKKLLQPFVTRFHVTYPILATGIALGDSLRTQKTLPEIQEIIGFPTTIFIDKKGTVRKIHTGFNGPGTGEHYTAFKKEFNTLIDALLSE